MGISFIQEKAKIRAYKAKQAAAKTTPTTAKTTSSTTTARRRRLEGTQEFSDTAPPSPQPKEEEEKLSPIQSRALALRTITSSRSLSPKEKEIRMRKVLTGRPTGMTRTQIRATGRPKPSVTMTQIRATGRPKPSVTMTQIRATGRPKPSVTMTQIRATGRPKPSVTMTQQQYFQEVSEGKQAIGKQKSEYYTMMGGIDLGASYEYEGGVVTGAYLKTKFAQDYLPQLEEAELQSQLAWSQARDLPKDTTVTKTEEGYEFKFRDTSLDWSKGEFKKIGQAPPGVQQVAEFGFGAVSSFGALLKPIVLDPLMGTEKSRGSHFVSPLDFAFEPIGWSPKGSSELMKEHPIFTAGGIGAEIVQSYAMAQAMKPVSAGVKIGAKALVKRVPGVYAKFTKVFPEEKFLSGTVSGSKKIFAKGSSELPENIFRWGAKGYKKGLELTSAGVKTSPKEIIKKAGSVIEKQKQKFVYGKGGVKRVWLSPTDFAKAEKDIAAKLAMKKVVGYSPQARLKAGLGEVSELFERTKYRLSWSGKRLVKKYGTTRQTWKLGDDLGLAKLSGKGDDLYKGFTRFAIEGAGEPIESSGWFALHKKMLTEGYGMPALKQIEQVPLESGGVLLGRMYERPVTFFKGFGSAGFRPMSKKWIARYRPPFLQNIQAQVSATMHGLKTKVTGSSGNIGHRLDLLPNLYAETIPSSMYKSMYGTGFKFGLFAMAKTLPITKRKYHLEPLFLTEQRKLQLPMFKKAQASMLDTFMSQDVAQVQAVAFKPVFVYDLLFERPHKTDTSKPRTTHPSFTSSIRPPLPFIPFPKLRMFGRGRKGWDYDLFGKKYKFRKRDMYDPLKSLNLKLF